MSNRLPLQCGASEAFPVIAATSFAMFLCSQQTSAGLTAARIAFAAESTPSGGAGQIGTRCSSAASGAMVCWVRRLVNCSLTCAAKRAVGLAPGSPPFGAKKRASAPDRCQPRGDRSSFPASPSASTVRGGTTVPSSCTSGFSPCRMIMILVGGIADSLGTRGPSVSHIQS